MNRVVWLTASLALICAPAAAETVEAGWDTYFYEAPGDMAHVTDEVSRKEPLDVLSCEAQWCRVRYGDREGYVREFVVRGPRNEVRPDGSGNNTACFAAVQPGGARWQSERFCHSGP